MTKLLFSLLVVLSAILGLAFQGWERIRPPAASEFTSVIAHPFDSGKLIAASRREIFVGTGDTSWQKLSFNSGGRSDVERLLFFEEDPSAIFALTQTGVLRVDLETGLGREIFRAQGAGKAALSLALSPREPEHWFLGTEHGLFETDDAGKTWFRFHRFPERVRIPLVRFVGTSLFVATRERLYVSQDLAHFRPVFSLLSGDDAEFLEIEEQEAVARNGGEAVVADGGEESSSSPRFFELTGTTGTFPAGPGLVWLASQKGVFESRDGGGRWSLLSRSGLQDSQIQHLVYAPRAGQLFAGTLRGVYLYLPEANRWQEIFKGLARPETKSLAVVAGSPETLIAVTGDGLMRYSIIDGVQTGAEAPFRADNLRLFHELIQREPTALQVQKEVVRYANLGNGKIKRWHAESRLASLLPNFSFGRDISKANNVDIDRGSTSESDRFILGPEDIDKGWDANVSWDVGDLLWSSNQTSIDSRDKLMVELRNDLLAEAIRIYYERRRLQTEIVFSPAPSERDHLERLLRIDELTALLDGMTEGFMSRRLEQIYEESPHFRHLWEFEAAAGPFDLVHQK